MNIVFGSGMCAINHWKYIEKYFPPDCLISNSKSKWGSFTLGGFVCQSPEEVLPTCREGAKVLIAIGDPEKIRDVKTQLAPYNLEIQTIYEFVERNSRYEPIPAKLVPLQSKHTKMLLLLNVAEHDNIGDHLITIAEKEFLESRFSEFPCVEVSDVEYMWFHRWLKSHVSHEDILLLTGGGFLGSLYLYNGEFNFRSMLVEFPHNAIITFPQTVFFEENLRGEKARRESCEMYKAHPHLTLIHRESNSYQRAKGMLSNAQMELIPDIVLSLDYSKGNVGKGGKGVNMCLRSDKESIFHKQKNLLCTALADRGYHLFYTSMHAGSAISESARMQICENKREDILSSDLVITDTLHCMILCAITGTPCIAIDTISHKIKYVYEWLKDLEYIKLATTSQKILSLVSEMFALGKSQFPINDIRPLFIPLENRIREVAQICPQN